MQRISRIALVLAVLAGLGGCVVRPLWWGPGHHHGGHGYGGWGDGDRGQDHARPPGRR